MENNRPTGMVQETELRLVRKPTEYEVPETLEYPVEAARIFEQVFDMSNLAQEITCAIFMDIERRVIGIEKIFAGGVSFAETSNQEIFKRALLHNAESIIICHNHPGGNCSPSMDDMNMTWGIVHAGFFLNIKLEEHIIIANGNYFPLLTVFSYEGYKPEDDFCGERLAEVYEMIEADCIPSFRIASDEIVPE